ncbi:ABC transporter permease [Actinomycetospora sp. NBRC 106378]|uniref:ABC transporter permease n=1 Tax=Actinomycetospora sp. NBRC 106378 TaxID=3032208 RepID=UPI0024A168DB|nr:ABC transporter permease [Actinomycetospora sp. NBRC 106378]GLZ50478.1 ABC transporter permease [Actinomycetospora sp. NBRC 106378]
MRTVLLITRREFLARVRGRAFVISTAVILLILVGYSLFVGSLSSAGDSGSTTVAVAPETLGITSALRTAADDQGRIVRVLPVSDAAAGRALVASGDADAALSGPPTRPRVDVETSLGSATGSVVTVATTLLAQQQLLPDPSAADAAIAAAEPVVVAARPEDPAQGLRIGLGAFGAFLLFFSIQTYGAMVAQGVVEEKSSRVVEIVLATVRPWQLLLGKVLGLGAVGLLQLVVLGGVGLGVAGTAGLLVAGAGLTGTLVSVLVWYLLGFTMYATVYAALGSLVSRQEDTQSVLTPVSIVVLIGFVAGFNLVLSAPTSTALTVLSLIPPWTPLVMPARIALGGVPLWEVALAFVLTAAFTALVLWLGGRIYARSVLRTGARVSWREAFTGR